MEYKREIIVHGDYFADFYDNLTLTVKQKINYVLNLVRIEEHRKRHPRRLKKQ